MSTEDPYEEWERKTRVQGAKGALLIVYEARFGAMPHALAAVVEAEEDVAALERWLTLAGTRSQEEIAAAVYAGSTALVS